MKDDVDGAPMDEQAENKFIKSKWEEVDESELESQGEQLLF